MCFKSLLDNELQYLNYQNCRFGASDYEPINDKTIAYRSVVNMF